MLQKTQGHMTTCLCLMVDRYKWCGSESEDKARVEDILSPAMRDSYKITH